MDASPSTDPKIYTWCRDRELAATHQQKGRTKMTAHGYEKIVRDPTEFNTPRHLTYLAGPVEECSCRDHHVKFDIRCPCGGETFSILYAGELITDEGPPFIRAGQLDVDSVLYIAKAQCTSCGVTHLLFDSAIHGDEGTVAWAGSVRPALPPRPPDSRWSCTKCLASCFRIRLEIYYTDPEQFMEEGCGDYDMSQWTDAYGYIDLSAVCVGCGELYPTFMAREAR